MSGVSGVTIYLDITEWHNRSTRWSLADLSTEQLHEALRMYVCMYLFNIRQSLLGCDSKSFFLCRCTRMIEELKCDVCLESGDDRLLWELQVSTNVKKARVHVLD